MESPTRLVRWHSPEADATGRRNAETRRERPLAAWAAGWGRGAPRAALVGPWPGFPSGLRVSPSISPLPAFVSSIPNAGSDSSFYVKVHPLRKDSNVSERICAHIVLPPAFLLGWSWKAEPPQVACSTMKTPTTVREGIACL